MAKLAGGEIKITVKKSFLQKWFERTLGKTTFDQMTLVLKDDYAHPNYFFCDNW